MKRFVPALAAAFIATIGASSVAHAALINFGVSVLDGAALGYTSGSTLDASTAFNFDGAALLVSSVGAGDDSGLTAFPGAHDTVGLSPTDIMYDSGTLGAPVVKSWTGVNSTGLDTFTETLTTVDSINRLTHNAITVSLSGTVTDANGLFTDTPVHFILSANQVAGPNTAIVAGFTNTTVIPEPSTWVMLALGFAGLGYAAVRRSAKDKAAIAV